MCLCIASLLFCFCHQVVAIIIRCMVSLSTTYTTWKHCSGDDLVGDGLCGAGLRRRGEGRQRVCHLLDVQDQIEQGVICCRMCRSIRFMVAIPLNCKRQATLHQMHKQCKSKGNRRKVCSMHIHCNMSFSIIHNTLIMCTCTMHHLVSLKVSLPSHMTKEHNIAKDLVNKWYSTKDGWAWRNKKSRGVIMSEDDFKFPRALALAGGDFVWWIGLCIPSVFLCFFFKKK